MEISINVSDKKNSENSQIVTLKTNKIQFKPDPKAAIHVINYTKKYSKKQIPAVANLNFKVMPGEFHAFIGANGAGKTTTIKAIVGAYARYQGKIFVFGHENTSIKAKDNLGYIPEAARFPKGMNLKTFLLTMAILSKIPKKEAVKKVKSILEKLSLSNLAKRSPETFSSGQKKKVLLSQALLHEPKVIVMDEPAANLDPKARIEFFDTLKVLQRDGVAIMISSHILAEIKKYADSATIIDDGKIVYSGRLEDENKTSEFNTSIHPKNSVSFENFLNEKGMKYKLEDDAYLISIPNKEKRNFINECFDKEIEFKSFSELSYDLEYLYNKYVVIGSVDTKKGKGDLNA